MAKKRFPSYEKLTVNDLRNLRNIAIKHIFYKDLICIALIQGAADHYVNGKRGINDFDIVFFYKENWHRKGKQIDAGKKFAKFGTHPWSKEREFEYRWIDLLHRKIGTKIIDEYHGNIEAILKNYFETEPTPKAGEWAKTPVVGLYPQKIFNKILWNPKSKKL